MGKKQDKSMQQGKSQDDKQGSQQQRKNEFEGERGMTNLDYGESAEDTTYAQDISRGQSQSGQQETTEEPEFSRSAGEQTEGEDYKQGE